VTLSFLRQNRTVNRRRTTSHRVLVVDDEENIRFLLESALRHFGFEVASASDGREALSAVAANRPDLIVLDVMMPGIDGVEVCRRLDHAAVKVIVLTAKDDPRIEKACRDAGADGFLTKPFSSAKLLDMVADLLQQ
jgi:DNA-binding response OmpR family regulator